MQDLNDKVTGNSLTAPEWNQVPSEIQNVIESLGITLSGGDLNQLGKAIAGYAANGQFYVDSGAAGAYVLSPVGSKKAPTAYTNGMRIAFLAANGNSGGASTVNVGGLGVTSLTDRWGNALTEGDIPTTVVSTAYYDAGVGDFILDTWDLSSQIQPITASVGSNALTVTINPQVLEFRSTTLTSGAVLRRVVHTPVSMTVSNGSTLGTISGVAARLLVIAIEYNGAVETAIINAACGANLDETYLIDTAAEGGAGGADNKNILYSTTTRGNRPFRVVGFIDITEATAGVWATAPTKIQGAGGNALTGFYSLGHSNYEPVTGSRSIGTTYYNTTGKPFVIVVNSYSSAAGAAVLTVDGVEIIRQYQGTAAGNVSVSGIIPTGSSYSVSWTAGTITLVRWSELR